MSERERERKRRQMPVGVFGSHHPLPLQHPFSPPSFLLPSLLTSLMRVWGLILLFNVLFYAACHRSSQTPGQKSGRGNEDRYEAKKRVETGAQGSMQRQPVDWKNRKWLDRRCRIRWHGSAVVHCNLFCSVCLMTHLFSCHSNDFTSCSVLQSRVSVE